MENLGNIITATMEAQQPTRQRPLKRIAGRPLNATEARDVLTAIGRRFVPEFTIDADNAFVYDNVARWCLGDPAAVAETMDGRRTAADLNKGIYIYGNAGTGKSLAMSVTRMFAIISESKVLTGANALYLNWRTVRADEICEEFGETGDVRDYINAPLLCVNDLGSEPLETLYMGNRAAVIRMLLERRGDMYNVLTMATSNYAPQSLGKIYGPRVASRIAAMFNFYHLGGKDRRNK